MNILTLALMGTAFATTPTVDGDGTTPTPSAAELKAEAAIKAADAAELATCEASLGNAQEDLADCTDKLVKAKAHKPKPATPPSTTSSSSTAQVSTTTVTSTQQTAPPDPAPAPQRVTITPIEPPVVVTAPTTDVPPPSSFNDDDDSGVPPVVISNNYELNPPTPPQVVSQPLTSVATATTTVTSSTTTSTNNPPSAPADSRFQVMVGAAAGIGYEPESIMDINNVQVGGGLELPTQIQFGAFSEKEGGPMVGGLAHVSLELAWGGSEVGGGVAVLSGGDKFHFGGELGGGYTAYRSLDGNANAELWNGEANLVGLVPLAQGTHFGADLSLMAGGKLGVLDNGAKSDTKLGYDGTATLGLLISIR